MIPFKAEGRPAGRSVVVWIIAVLCVVTLVRLASLPEARAAAVVEALGLVPSRFFGDPFSPAQLVTLVTSAFLHAGWVHLAGNMLFLAVFGPTVEARLGWKRFLLLYLAAGVAGSLGHAAAFPSSTVPLVGASGAIAGVLGAHIVLDPRARIRTLVPVVIFFEVAVLPSAFVIGWWFVLQLASALAPVTTSAAAGGVAWFAHIFGFSAGMLMAAPAAISARTKRRRRRAAGAAT